MAIFKSYWASNVLPPVGKKVEWSARTVDIMEIESWQYADKFATKVFMKSGDKFYIRCSYDELSDLVHAFTDGYGKLFTFNDN